MLTFSRTSLSICAAGLLAGCASTYKPTFDHAERVESPCVRKCTLDGDDICVGCFRSIDEICAWGGASDDRRRDILQNSARRRRENSKSA